MHLLHESVGVLVVLTFYFTNFCNGKYNSADITLIGAYGDLSKKYLWNAMFDLYNEYDHNGNWTLSFVGGGLKNMSLGKSLLKDVLKKAIICIPDKHLDCKRKKELFLEEVSYLQLKNEQDYAKYCSNLYESALQHYCHKDHECQYQHIFYLSVPSFTYQSISSYIAAHCRPVKGAGSLKVVFEKPFGHNQLSANALAVSILQHLKEEEIYRVDHYLGKQAVQEILPFRKNNKNIEKMMNDDYLDRLEVVMKESFSVKGRISFYDKYGVIADVMNNHLSEILYLLTMNLPTNIENKTEVDINKLQLVKQLQTVESQDLVVGQYQETRFSLRHIGCDMKFEWNKKRVSKKKGYQDEVNMEKNALNKSLLSSTPTFAGVKLKLKSLKWDDLSIIMVAGKMMNLRTGYARLVFKENIYSINSLTDCSQQQEIVFHIGHGPIKKPAILISNNLPLNVSYKPKHWSLETDSFSTKYLSQPLSCYRVFTPDVTRDAYVFLVRQLFLGRQEHFLRLPTLLESWRVWGPVVEDQRKDLRIYPGGNKTGTMLDFTYAKQGLSFINSFPLDVGITFQNFLGRHVVLGSISDISHLLAEEVITAAKAVVSSGRDFHIALSGGSSPLYLFKHLASQHGDDVVWRHIHVWQVDERCSLNTSFSNLEQLSSKLFDNLPHLRFTNIHPMLVQSSLDSLCSEEAAALYGKWIETHLGSNPQFDFVILGMGSNGHTASLFPNHTLLHEQDKFVAVADHVSPSVSVKKRMTITFPLINQSKQVAVIVSGEAKCEKLRVMKETQCESVDDLPVCGVSPKLLSWFIDVSCKTVFE